MENVSSVLGYYNILAYVIPGMLHLYVLNEVARLGALPYLELSLLNNANVPPALVAVEIIAIILAAFVISHLLEPIAVRIIYLIIGPKPMVESLDRLKRVYPNIKINFAPHEVEMLRTVIQQRSKEVSRLIEQYQALSVMLRNLSVGFLLLSVLEFTNLLLSGDSSQAIFGIFALMLSIAAISRSTTNRLWSYNIIYEAALEYGSNLEEVIDSSSYRRDRPKQIKQRRTKTNSGRRSKVSS